MTASNLNELSEQISGYPYLKIARKYKSLGTTVEYSDVLCFADAYKKQFRGLNIWEQRAKDRLQRSRIAEEIIEIHRIMDNYVAHNK